MNIYELILIGAASACAHIGTLYLEYKIYERIENTKNTIRNADMVWIHPNATAKLINLAEEAHEKDIEKAPILCGQYNSGTVSIEGVINDKFPLCLRHFKHQAPNTYLLTDLYRGIAGLKRKGPILHSHNHLFNECAPSTRADIADALVPSDGDVEVSKSLPEVLLTYDPFTRHRYNTKVCRSYKGLFCFLHYLPDENTFLNRPKGTRGWVETRDPVVKLGIHAFTGHKTIPAMLESDEVAIICGSRKEWQKIEEQNPNVKELFNEKEILFSLETA